MMTTKGNFPLLAESDIVISGGGPAGVAAALAAARRGYRVLLLEQTGTLGGLATSGLVPTFAPSTDGERFLYGGNFANHQRYRQAAPGAGKRSGRTKPMARDSNRSRKHSPGCQGR